MYSTILILSRLWDRVLRDCAAGRQILFQDTLTPNPKRSLVNNRFFIIKFCLYLLGTGGHSQKAQPVQAALRKYSVKYQIYSPKLYSNGQPDSIHSINAG